MYTWSVNECSAAIISACLPTLGSLVHLPSITSSLKRALNSASTNTRGAFYRAATGWRGSIKSRSKESKNEEGERQGTELSSEMRKQQKEAKVDAEDIGEGIKRPAFFKLPSHRRRGTEFAMNVHGGKGKRVGDQEMGGMGGDATGIQLRSRMVLNKDKDE